METTDTLKPGPMRRITIGFASPRGPVYTLEKDVDFTPTMGMVITTPVSGTIHHIYQDNYGIKGSIGFEKEGSNEIEKLLGDYHNYSYDELQLELKKLGWISCSYKTERWRMIDGTELVGNMWPYALKEMDISVEEFEGLLGITVDDETKADFINKGIKLKKHNHGKI